MRTYRVPLVPLVTIRATYDCVYWPNECGRCGAEVRTATGAELDYSGDFHHGGGYVCPTCGPIPSAEVSPTDDPPRWGGWCDPSDPWGTLWGDDGCRADDGADAYGRNGPPVEIVLPVFEAARFLVDFPGGVWDLCEGESSVNYRTGVDVSVTAHAHGPGAVAALELAGKIMRGEVDA